MSYKEIVSREPITKGWSEDQKFRVLTQDGTSYLLRISPFERKAHRWGLFDRLKEVSRLGVPICEPVEIGECEEGVYTLYTWVDGKDAEEMIPGFTTDEQYQMGTKAGKLLKQMHTLPAPNAQEDWHARFLRKTENKIKKYQACGVRFKGDDEVIAYLERNRDAFRGRPQSFQHGDYHIGNMMVEKGEIVIIDFDRFDYGDPWEEFNRIAFCAQVSPQFASGMVDGYFDGQPPDLFWKCLAYYIGSNMLSSIYWALDFDQSDLEGMIAQTQEILQWYQGFRVEVPSWYENDNS